LVVDDAIVLAAPPTSDGSEPHVSLVYHNGNPMMGADWHNAISPEHDVPHRSHDDASGERFWWDASAAGSSSQPPASQPEPESDQNADSANGQQNPEPVAGVADQVQGEQSNAANAAPQVAGDAAQVNEAPSPEQPAQ
jgi:hypothetical protein